jgi:hypothetical protein
MASVRRVDVQLPEMSPAAPVATATQPAAPPRRFSAGWLFLLAAGLLLFGGLAVGVAADSNTLLLAAGSLSAVVALAGAIRGVAALIGARFSPPGAPALRVPLTLLALAGNLAMASLGALAAFASTITFSRGRQLRRHGEVLLPPVTHGDAWTRPDLAPRVDPAVRAALAAQWRENGRTEHASVAAFARLTLDLMALGAPPALVASANRDALDEIRHAELCFGLARALDGRLESPGLFPEAARARTLPALRTLALALLAVDSLVDGALHEGVSARIAARLARCCEDPAIRAVLREIAADEGRHAAHGWDVVEWCLAEGGEPVAHALRGALSTLPRRMRSGLPAAARIGGWERHGIHGHELETQEYAKARAHVTSRAQDLVMRRHAAAA